MDEGIAVRRAGLEQQHLPVAAGGEAVGQDAAFAMTLEAISELIEAENREEREED